MSELSVCSTSLITESTPPQSKTVILYLRPFPFSPWRKNKLGFLQSVSSLRTNKVTQSADTWYLCYSFLKKKTWNFSLSFDEELSNYLFVCSCLLVLFCIIMLRWLALACPLSEYEKGKSTFPRWPDGTFPKACITCTVYEVLEISEKKFTNIIIIQNGLLKYFLCVLYCVYCCVVRQKQWF